jgi:hypothetical protein
MTRTRMMMGAALTILTGAFVACGVATSNTGETVASDAVGAANPSIPSSAAEPASAPAADPVPAAAGDHPRIFDSQRARVFSEAVRQEKAAQLAALMNNHDEGLTVAPLSPDFATSPKGVRANGHDLVAAFPPAPNFTANTYKPVSGAAATWGTSWTVKGTPDQLFFGTASGGSAQGTNIGINNANGAIKSGCTGTVCSGNNFFSLNNLYDNTTGPTLQWAAFVSGGSSANVAVSATGSRVYVLSDSGILYCFAGATGANCTGWTNPTGLAPTGAAITPWVDTGANAVYVADGNKGLYRINATTGTKQWGGTAFAYTTNAASKAFPVEISNILYLGDGGGNLWRIEDRSTGTTDAANLLAPSVKASVAMSATNCTAPASIDGSVSLDVSTGQVFLPNQACIFSMPHYCASGCTVTSGTWAVSASGYAGSIPNTTFRTWPSIDGAYVYWVIADKPTSYTPVSSVWKAPYSLSPVNGTNLINASSSVAGAGVSSSPVLWNGLLYVGDQSGYVEEFGCASASSSTTSFTAETTVATGSSVNTPIVFDDATGNIEYGFTNGTTGGIAQFPLWLTGTASTYSWNCPTGYVACDNQTCGAGNNKTACVPTAKCNATSAACATAASISTSGIQCASATEGNTVTLTCPTGEQIQSIIGASYGLPTSTCPATPPTFSQNGSCNSSNSLDVTYSLCGTMNSNNSCSFSASNANFGDPCVGTGKNYAVWFVCAPHISTTVPPLCSRANVTPTTGSDPCTGGSCSGTCSTGFADCNTNKAYDGCETDTRVDSGNCGGCGTNCNTTVGHASGATCSNSVCAFSGSCSAGYGNCDSNSANGCESDFSTSTTNCGACGTNCNTNVANAAGVACSASACTYTGACTSGKGDCDANKANGCEATLGSTLTSCGCGINCSTTVVFAGSPACSSNACTYGGACTAGHADCNALKTDGCEVNTQTDASNCGGCGYSCGTGGTCSAGICQYTVAGTYTVTVPTGSSLKPTIVAIGGGGGGSTTGSGSGAGGAALCSGAPTTAVAAGDTITVVVGAAGASLGNGGATSVTDTTATRTLATANGGTGGNTSGTATAGGTGTAVAGLTCNSGGAGGAATNPGSNNPNVHGGSGGAAGYTGAGGAGGTATGSAASCTANLGDGTAGAGGGGGGGGAGSTSSNNSSKTYSGGAGGGTGLTTGSAGALGGGYCNGTSSGGTGADGSPGSGGTGTTYGGGGGTATSGGGGAVSIKW